MAKTKIVLLGGALCLTACAGQTLNREKPCRPFDASTPIAMDITRGSVNYGKKVLQPIPNQPLNLESPVYRVTVNDVEARFSPNLICDDGGEVVYSINQENSRIFAKWDEWTKVKSEFSINISKGK